MRDVVTIACLAVTGCGRLGFDDHGMAADDATLADAEVDARVTTGPTGERWMKQLGDPTVPIALAGSGGQLLGLQRFTSTFAGDGVALSGLAFISSALVRYAVDGTVIDTRVFDSDGICDIRVVLVDGTDLVVGGFTQGTTAIPARGACSIVTNRQDPIVIRIDAAGTETVTSHWSASGANAQLWTGARFADGQLVFSGIYGASLTIGSPLPTATVDPSAWVARPFDGIPNNARWVFALTDTSEVHAGPVAAYGTTAFMMGSFTSNPTLMGVPLTGLGGYDTWIAHVPEDSGPVQFVRAIQSTMDEPQFGSDSSLVALPDGGCVVAIKTGGDVTYDSQLFPASGGEGLVLRLDGSGNLVYGLRLQSVPKLAVIGNAIYAAFAVTTPVTIGGAPYVPAGTDTVIVELDASGPSQLVGTITGSGDQFVDELTAIGPDALGVTGISTGPLAFGATSFNTGGNVRVVGALGV